MIIKDIQALELLDSRGMPTVGARLVLEDGSVGHAIVPSGASTGSLESVELRDGDQTRYFGRGVCSAVSYVNSVLRDALINTDYTSQRCLDSKLCELDATKQKSRYGANALLAISQAFFRACAVSQQLQAYAYFDTGSRQLPVPFLNMINGGVHADNNIGIQEFMVVPHGFDTFSEAIRSGSEIHHVLGGVLKRHGVVPGRGDEGGYAPNLKNSETVLDLMGNAVRDAGYNFSQVAFALDCASSSFYHDGYYFPNGRSGEAFDSAGWVDYLADLVASYPIVSLEDAMSELDWEGWSVLTSRLGGSVQLVGDDLFVTKLEILKKGVNAGVANAILIKPNQVGTVSETIETIRFAKESGYHSMVSHRSGETEDTFIADLAVGMGVDQIKAGPLRQQDRVSKYNRLLWIENMFGDASCYSPGSLAKYLIVDDETTI